ncbi:hypothetical protein ACFW2V_13865 [Streptomyces sp. NPDC058947]|uniref:hypothetical protein n=1 Tax=Streptomyces sp. NPDC058947 TaxID=3346675 RepID=UPI003688F864
MGGITEEELESSISSSSMGAYRRAPSYDQPQILEWVSELREMSDEAFVVECASRILDSAIMNGYRGNAWGAHARADICHDEAQRRHEKAGHDASCRGDTLYSEGHNKALTSQGHKTNPVSPCTCGLEKSSDD